MELDRDPRAHESDEDGEATEPEVTETERSVAEIGGRTKAKPKLVALQNSSIEAVSGLTAQPSHRKRKQPQPNGAEHAVRQGRDQLCQHAAACSLLDLGDPDVNMHPEVCALLSL